jgi:hypothetical protein
VTRTLFAGAVFVHYRQVYVCDGKTFPDGDDSCAGQANGLLGTRQPGVLFLTTGLHTGDVGLTVELADEETPVGDAWEDVVEASWTVSDGDVAVVEWAADDRFPVALPVGQYRVRLSARGLDAANEADTSDPDTPPVDEYLLTFWPAPPGPDVVVRTTSDYAAYWHRVARGEE